MKNTGWMRAAALWVPVALATGCASGPPVGGLTWVGIDEIVEPAALTGHTGYSADRNVDAERLHAAGLTLADVEAGRLALVFCSPSVDATWYSFAVLPPGQEARVGQVVRLRVEQDTTNERIAVNPAVGGVEPDLPSSLRAYDLIPDWRERGLRDNYRKVELPEDRRGRYRVVQGSYVIAC